jgi:2-succinyl-6-hydroxy-2,4-cyclohexadiene-1-carboxylate synthase
MADGTVMLLHGLLGAPASWDDVVRALGDRVSAPAIPWLPGHGPAAGALPEGGFEAVVEGLGALWLTARTTLVGYSLGGRLALALAARFPERVRGVVAIGAHTGLTSPAERTERAAWEQGLVADLERDGLPAFVDAWEQQPIFATQAALSQPDRDRQREIRLGHHPAGIAWAIDVLGTGKMPALLGPLARGGVPVIFAVGALDRRAVAVAREAMGVLPRAEVVVVPEAGHNLLLEAPGVVADLILEVAGTPGRSVAPPRPLPGAPS